MNNEAFLLLFEAIMKQAYEDANQTKDEALAEEAQSYINGMKEMAKWMLIR